MERVLARKLYRYYDDDTCNEKMSHKITTFNIFDVAARCGWVVCAKSKQN